MQKYYKRMRPLLGTFVEIGAPLEEPNVELAVLAAFQKIEFIQNLLSFHNPESELSYLNRSCGTKIQLHSISIIALRIARYMTKTTGGLFNFTLGGKLVKNGNLPNHENKEFLDSGTAEDLEIKGKTVLLRRPLRITLDGIAKGLAVDLAVKEMKSNNINKGWINAGGDLKVFGELTLPIHRREDSGEIKLLGHFQNTAVATSKLNLLADESFPGQIVSTDEIELSPGVWSIQASSAWLADALTKVACIASMDERDIMVRRNGGNILAVHEGFNERLS